jgi:cobalt-zinc-cadmium efflux system outer membrane protein
VTSSSRPVGTAAASAAAVILMLGVALSGCVLSPSGTAEQRARLNSAAQLFEPPFEARQVPALPQPAGWRDVLSRAFLTNGELESAYFEWKAALARIDQAAVWPNSNVAISFGYLFSSDNIKTWNRTTITAGFDPAVDLSLPIKARAAGKVALEAAKESAENFRSVKFEIQRKVLAAYLDLALAEEKIRIQRDNLNLLQLLVSSASARAQSGGPQPDLLKAMTESQLAQNELASLEAEIKGMRAMLNGMLGRDSEAPLELPQSLPLPRPVLADDAGLIAVAVAQNPELEGLSRRVAGRKDAIELAKLAYLPDVVPSASVTGSLSQFLSAMVMLPTTLPAIRAMIADAQAMERSAEAMARQTKQDRAASFVANLFLMRNAERQTELYRARVVPAVQQLLVSSRESYAAGAVTFADLIDSERMYVAVRAMVAEAQIEREKRLAELEALAGVDIETLGQPRTAGAQLTTHAGATR